MKKEYYWWDLEDTIFKGILYDSINMYFLNTNPYKNWDEFAKADPHMAYAHLIYIRFNALEQQFVDLRVIPQMLGVQDIPLKSNIKDINRYEWLKSIVDLALFRFSSLRDIAFHFVNEVLELKLPDHKLNINQLNRILKETHPEILKNLKILDISGASLRFGRNERAHKGFYNLYTDDDEMFKSMSWAEQYNSQIVGYDLVSIYEKSMNTIYNFVVEEAQTALTSCIDLSNELYTYYRDKHEELSINSVSGVSYHFHNYHKENN